MSNNLIQVKRSTTTRQPTSLAFGEVAYTTNGQIMWIGREAANTANVVAIGGERFPGVLTANQALVADGNKMIDTIMVGNSTVNAVVNSTSLKVSNSTSNSTFTIPTSVQYAGNFFLHANGTWATPAGGIAGSNTQLQFNDSGSAGASAGLVFDKTTNNLTVANTLSVPIVGANVTFVGNSSVTGATITGNSTVTETKVSSSVANVQSATIALAGTTTTITSNVVVTDTTVTVTSNTQNYKANSTVTGLSVVGNSTATVVTLGSGASVVNVVSTNAFFTTTNTTIASSGGTNITGGVVTIAPNTNFSSNVTIAGDLVVNGTTFTVNVDTIAVEDSIIKVGSNNLTTDTIDLGLYGVFGNSTVTKYSGLVRDASNSGIWTLFYTESEPGTTVNTAAGTFARQTLLANFSTEVFTANSTKVNITAGSMNTDLSVTDGGTGAGSFTQYGILYGNTTSPISVTAAGTEGLVLQAGVGGVPQFATLDGGSF